MSSKSDRPSNAKPMVGWFDPGQLIRTAWEVMVSTLIGRHSDQRLMEAVINPKPDRVFDYTTFHKPETERYEPIANDCSRPRKEIWVDYVADTGDGWNSTYAIACALARPTIPVKWDQTHYKTKRGAVLIMGGDEVYPTARRSEYKNRLLLPFECAMKNSVGDHPHVYAIPGNHDWYDSLVSFSRVFIGKEWLAGWYAPQDRSYFALKLPGHWWFIGVDTQLGSDIDGLQVEYFEKIAEQIKEDPLARVVLCCPEPQWIYLENYDQDDREKYNDSNLAYLSNVVFQGRIRAYVAGDLHHYRRHANQKNVQKITAGGGGAFLHPTHAPSLKSLRGDVLPGQEREQDPLRENDAYVKAAAYPDERTSRRLAWGNLLFLWHNPMFGGFAAILYLLVDLALGLTSIHRSSISLPEWFGRVGARMIEHQGSALIALTLVLLVSFFTDTHKRIYQWIAGPIHGILHLLAAIFCAWVAAYCTTSLLGASSNPLLYLFIDGLIITMGAWMLSSTIMGLYLLVSLNVFARHDDEAFSSMAIAHFKNFLRFHVAENGDLTIYPMKIERVPRKWEPAPANTDPGKDDTPVWMPVDRPLVVELIERPIKVDRSADAESATVRNPDDKTSK